MADRSKYYSNRGNCIRAAKVVLGKDAKPDVDFELLQEGKSFAWKAKGKENIAAANEVLTPATETTIFRTKRTRAANGERGNILQQPQMAKVLGLMQRVTGASVEEIAERLECNRDTARGMVSRCKTAGAPVTTTRESRFVRYLVDAEWGK